MTFTDSDFTGSDFTDFKVPVKTWEYHPLRPTWSGDAVGFDQTIAHTAWFHVRATTGQEVVPLNCGMLSTTAMGSGHEDSLLRCEVLAGMMMAVITSIRPDVVFHESPAVSIPGAKMKRTDSSLLAALTLRLVAGRLFMPVMTVSAQSARLRLFGKKDATKPEVTAGIRSIYPEVLKMKPNNDNTRDALVVALVGSEKFNASAGG